MEASVEATDTLPDVSYGSGYSTCYSSSLHTPFCWLLLYTQTAHVVCSLGTAREIAMSRMLRLTSSDSDIFCRSSRGAVAPD